MDLDHAIAARPSIEEEMAVGIKALRLKQ